MTAIEKVRAWPLTVKLSALMLVIVWCLLMMAFTPFMVVFTLLGLTIASIIRLVSYFTN